MNKNYRLTGVRKRSDLVRLCEELYAIDDVLYAQTTDHGGTLTATLPDGPFDENALYLAARRARCGIAPEDRPDRAQGARPSAKERQNRERAAVKRRFGALPVLLFAAVHLLFFAVCPPIPGFPATPVRYAALAVLTLLFAASQQIARRKGEPTDLPAAASVGAALAGALFCGFPCGVVGLFTAAQGGERFLRARRARKSEGKTEGKIESKTEGGTTTTAGGDAPSMGDAILVNNAASGTNAPANGDAPSTGDAVLENEEASGNDAASGGTTLFALCCAVAAFSLWRSKDGATALRALLAVLAAALAIRAVLRLRPKTGSAPGGTPK